MTNRGFTLLETLIYIGLFGILMAGGIVGTYSLIEGSSDNVDAAAIQEEGTFINRKIDWALESATAASVSGGGSTLTITRPDLAAQSPLVLVGGSHMITLARGSGVAVALNSDRYPVENVVFVYDAPSGSRPPSVTTTFTIENKSFHFRTYIRQ